MPLDCSHSKSLKLRANQANSRNNVQDFGEKFSPTTRMYLGDTIVVIIKWQRRNSGYFRF